MKIINNKISIDYKFRFSNHSFMKNDSDFKNIELREKRKNIHFIFSNQRLFTLHKK